MSDSIGSRGEAHHGGFTDDRRQIWVSGLDDSKIYIFDVATEPSNPKLVKTIDDFIERSGAAVGPHGEYALPGRVMISPRLPRWRESKDDNACIQWARDLFKATEPFATGSAYVNFMPEDEAERVEKVYGANYRRLAEIKGRYDPHDMFRMNQNIWPSQ